MTRPTILATAYCSNCNNIIWTERKNHGIHCVCGRVGLRGTDKLAQAESRGVEPDPVALETRLAEEYPE